MILNESDANQLDSKVIQGVLNEALGQVRPSSFAVLYAIGQLVQKYPGKPVTMITITKVSGVGERTAQTSVKELRKAMFLDITETPTGNVYEFIPVDSGSPKVYKVGEFTEVGPLRQGGANISGASYVSTYSSSSTTSRDEYVGEVSKTDVDTHGIVAEPVVITEDLGNTFVISETRASQRSTTTSHHSTGVAVTSPMPPKVRRMNIFSAEIRELVGDFEAFVARDAKKRISETRRRKWFNTTVWLVFTQKRPVAEIHQVIDFIFTRWGGVLPFPVGHGERKVTRMAQIAFNYDEILAVMGINR